MDKPPHSWTEFWDREARLLCESLPSPLVGSAPISVLCLQPCSPKRMVFLHRSKDAADPIYLPLGPNSESQIYQEGPSALWDSVPHPHIQKTLTEYLKLPKSIRRKLYNIESALYGKSLYDHAGLHLLLGEQYRLQTIVPSPLFHDQQEWWVRLPRFGLCYTIAEQLGHFKSPGPVHTGTSAEKLLLLAAVSAGDRILSTRLNMVLLESWLARTSTRRRLHTDENGSSGVSAEQVIARDLCTRGIHVSGANERDRCLYLIARLLFSHHILFPHSPVALRLFDLLCKDTKVNATDILERHGWQAATVSDKMSMSIDDNLSLLIADLMFLIRALVPRELTWETHNTVLSDQALEAYIRELLLDVLGVVCGVVESIGNLHMVVPPSALLSQKTLIVPAYSTKQIVRLHNKKKMAPDVFARFLNFLCPISPEEKTGSFHAIPYKARAFTANGNDRSTLPQYEWFGKYVRARIELDEVDVR